MELIKEIFEKDVIKEASTQSKIYHLRKAARAILFKNDKVAILYVAKNTYHKLPGGGLKKGETSEEALHREILEETGCKAMINEKIGLTIEYKDTTNVLQISYIFIATVISESTKCNFTKLEKSEGFSLEWHPLDTLQEIFLNDDPKDYHGKFITIRDRAIIEYVKQIQNIQKTFIKE